MHASSESQLVTDHPNDPQQELILLGRDAKLATLEQALKRSAIVTISGLGGIGKTTLALRAIKDAAGSFAETHIIEE